MAADDHFAVLELAKDLKVLSEIETDEWLFAAPVFANGVLYVATSKSLLAIIGQDKAPSWGTIGPSSAGTAMVAGWALHHRAWIFVRRAQGKELVQGLDLIMQGTVPLAAWDCWRKRGPH